MTLNACILHPSDVVRRHIINGCGWAGVDKGGRYAESRRSILRAVQPSTTVTLLFYRYL